MGAGLCVKDKLLASCHLGEGFILRNESDKTWESWDLESSRQV